MHIDHQVLSDLQDVMESGYQQLLETFWRIQNDA